MISVKRFRCSRESDSLQLHIVGAEKIGEVEFRRGAALHADFNVVELQDGRSIAGATDQKALAIVIGNCREYEFEVDLARHRPGRVAREHVDLSGLQ